MTVLEHEHQGEMLIYSSPVTERFAVNDKIIARGKFGVVKRLQDKKTGEVFAGKFVKRGDVEREARLHSEVGVHPFIIGMEAFYRNKVEMVIVMELATRGDIFEYCVGKCPFTEEEAKEATRQVTSALDFIHSKHIVHMDLKPQNILLSDDGKCRLADFGLSRKIPPGQRVCEISGTPEYTAPEILDYSPVTPAADIWSLGCVIYVMLTGLSPFAGEDLQETYLNVSQVDLDFEYEEWEEKSQHSIDLISLLCQARPTNRPKASEILEHIWLTSGGLRAPLRPVDEEHLTTPLPPAASPPAAQDKELASPDETIIVTNKRSRVHNRRSQQESDKRAARLSGDSDSGVSISDDDSSLIPKSGNSQGTLSEHSCSGPRKQLDFFIRRENRRALYKVFHVRHASLSTPHSYLN